MGWGEGVGLMVTLMGGTVRQDVLQCIFVKASYKLAYMGIVS